MVDHSDPYVYLTTWSLIISYSILIWGVILGIPRWLFLFAACFLTTTSVIGSFFLTLPSANALASKFNIPIQQVFFEDFLVHSGPLILFLIFFCLITKKVIKDKEKLFNFKGFKFTIGDRHKIFLLAIVIIIAYLGYIKFEKIYYYDYFTLVILTAATFVTSYQVYSRMT